MGEVLRQKDWQAPAHFMNFARRPSQRSCLLRRNCWLSKLMYLIPLRSK